MHLESSGLLQNKTLCSLVKNNTPLVTVQAASLSSIAPIVSLGDNGDCSSPDTLVSDSLNGVGVGGVFNELVTRWVFDPLFPRAVPLFQHLSSVTKEDGIARNGLVEGQLLQNKDAILPLIGIVALEWSDWLSSLSFIPLTPLWVWILDPRWKTIISKLFPDLTFIDGSTTSLPSVDILLLSRVSLSRCMITLSSAPFSLLVTTSNNILRSVRDIAWKKRFWIVPHTQVGGGTTGLFKLYSLSRISYFELPVISFLPHLPSGNVGRVVDEMTGAANSVLDTSLEHLLSSDLFPLWGQDTLFKVKSIFTPARWQIRSLDIKELLRLWDYSDNVISALSGRHRKLLWDNNTIPLRVLGLFLRFLVLPIRGTGGLFLKKRGHL